MSETPEISKNAENMAPKPVELSRRDAVGTLFSSDKLMLRGIHEIAADDALELLNSGLIEELIAKGLFPETKVAATQLPGFKLTLSHRRISPLIHPHEWSPEMLRAAGLAMLDVMETAFRYGYDTKDAHPFNIVFDGNKPLFVDFGSFSKMEHEGFWTGRRQFVSSFYHVLRLAERNLMNLYAHAFFYNGASYGYESRFALSPIFTILGAKWARRFDKWGYMWYRRGLRFNRYRAKYSQDSLVHRGIRWTIDRLAALTTSDDLTYLRKKLQKLKFQGDTTWGNYHEWRQFYDDAGNIILSDRMAYIKDAVGRLAPSTVLEFGGNQGILSRSMAEFDFIDSIVCSDYDAKAVDKLFLRLGDERKLTPACFDFVMGNSATSAADRPERLKSDVVLALALTHHLILGQKIAIQFIIDRMAEYSNKYLIIEYMPRGLWDGTNNPETPDWYTEEWFLSALETRFNVLERNACEENRVTFVCEKK